MNPESFPLHPLIRRLVEDLGYPLLSAADVDAFVDAPGVSVLFFTEDPSRTPESTDVAVILPELEARFGGALRVGVIDRADERELQQRFGFVAWPALVFHREGGYLGTISRVQEWGIYLQRIADLREAPVTRPPTIGIPVRASGPLAPGCH
jgi:hydrogenase-1 operon protein HyaE